MLQGLLDKAMRDRLNGASGVLTFFKSNGTFSRFLIHFFFLSEDGDTQRFYGAARDVTVITNLYKHMDLISKFSSHCVIFLLKKNEKYTFDVGAQGMEQEMKLNKYQLQAELNSGQFFTRVVPEDHDRMVAFTRKCISERTGMSERFGLINTAGERLDLFIRSDFVEDDASDVRCILMIRNYDE